jgi:hypothetical protein
VLRYTVYVSMDGVKWGKAVATGTLTKDAAEKELVFLGSAGRFVRLVAQSEVNGHPWTNAAEIELLRVRKQVPSPPWQHDGESRPRGDVRAE